MEGKGKSFHSHTPCAPTTVAVEVESKRERERDGERERALLESWELTREQSRVIDKRAGALLLTNLNGDAAYR